MIVAAADIKGQRLANKDLILNEQGAGTAVTVRLFINSSGAVRITPAGKRRHATALARFVACQTGNQIVLFCQLEAELCRQLKCRIRGTVAGTRAGFESSAGTRADIAGFAVKVARISLEIESGA